MRRQVRLDELGTMSGDDDRARDAGGRQRIEHAAEERLAANFDEALRFLGGQGQQPGALSGGEDDAQRGHERSRV